MNKLFIFLFLIIVNCTPRLVLKNSSVDVDIYNRQPDYKKTNVNHFMGIREYSLSVSPAKPQKFKSTWFTTKKELETHQVPVCKSGIQTIVIRGDGWDYWHHFFIGWFSSPRSIEVFCN
jgi:hypothetical protein